MKVSSITVLAALLVLGLPPSAHSMFLSSSALLPVSAIVSLGGVGGLKLAIAMKLLGMLGGLHVARYGVSLPTSLESDRLPDRMVPVPKPRKASSAGDEISEPIAFLPHILTTGRYLRNVPVRHSARKFFLHGDRTGRFDLPEVKFSADGSASIRGTKGSMLHASGELKSPLVNLQAQKTATMRVRRDAELDYVENHPLIIQAARQLMHDLETDECVRRLSCEVSADPPRYGSYGTRLAAVMEGTGPVARDPAFTDLVTAFIWGKAHGVPGCANEYPSCQYDLAAIVSLVEAKPLNSSHVPATEKLDR
ncbi:hypothetical protein HPB51_028403 [Rhipicephalus microplus]|uniref:Uncharacterized protein n=1 Tax=Rhipicephalus microplus TaxID=6941 RepID=A0A9J6CXD7_RHIMP|nr:hypothetical protein HPB51_028403 [Rhipicephalus microplus]